MGYLKGNTQFKNVVTGLISNMGDRGASKVLFHYLSDSLYRLNCTQKAFIDFITNNKVRPITRYSEMHEVMEMLAMELDSFDVGILVSDCILSYRDTDGNPNKNRDNAGNQLKASVKTVFRKLHKRGMAASVYGFKSAFTGKYFPYDNTPGQKYDDIRPYYVWIIARPEQRAQLGLEFLDHVAEKQMHFGLFSEPDTAFDLFFTTGKTGTWRADKAGINDISITPGDTVGFVIGVNLEKLPAYAREVSYIEENIRTGLEHLRLKKVVLKKDFQLDKENGNEKLFKEHNTHFLWFQLDNLPENRTAEIVLPSKADTSWYRQWSTMDDRNKNLNNEKTFAFEHLIDGVKQAYEANNPPFLRIALPLKN